MDAAYYDYFKCSLGFKFHFWLVRKKRFEIYTHIRNILFPITKGTLLHPPSQSTVELVWLKICHAGRFYTLRWLSALQSNEQGKRLPLLEEKLELSKLAAIKAINLKINNNENYLFTKWDTKQA